MGTTGTNVELRLSAVTDDFKSQMGSATKALRDWREGVNGLTQSASAVQQFGSSVASAAQGLASGNIAQAITGIASSLSGAAIAIPSVTTGMGSLVAIGASLAPFAAVIGAIGLAVAGVAAIVYQGAEAWSAYKDSIAVAEASGRSLQAALSGPIKDSMTQISALVAQTKGQVDSVGLTSQEAQIGRVNEQLFKSMNHLEGLNSLRAEAYTWFMASTGAEFTAAQAQLKAIDTAIVDEQTRIGLLNQARAATNELIVKEAQLAKQREAAAAAAERRKQFSQWGSDTGTSMDFTAAGDVAAMGGQQTVEGITDELNRAVDALSAGLNNRIENVGTLAARTFDDLQEKMLEAGDGFVADVQAGTTTLAGNLYNAAVDVFGPEVTSAIVDCADRISKSLNKAVPGFAGKVEAAMGDAGDMMKQVGQGFSSGGIWGAIIAVIMNLLQRMSAFKDIISMLSQSMGNMAEIFNPFVEALKPIFKAFIKLSEVLTQLANNMALGYVAAATLGKVVEIFSNAVGWVADGIATVYNWVVDKIASFVGLVNDDWAKSVRRSKINTGDMGQTKEEATAAEQMRQQEEQTLESLRNMIAYSNTYGADNGEIDSAVKSARKAAIEDGTAGFKSQVDELVEQLLSLKSPEEELAKSSKDAADNISDVSDAAKKASESLTNVPSWYKVQTARYNAAQPSAVQGLTGGGVETHSYQIGTMTVVANNPAELQNALADNARRANVIRTGSARFAYASPYGSGRVQPK